MFFSALNMLVPALRFPSEPCSQTRCDLFTAMYFQRIPTAEWARWRVRRQMRPRRGSRARSGRRRFVWCRASTAFGFHSTEERYVTCSTAGSAAVLDHSSPKAVGCARSGVGSAERMSIVSSYCGGEGHRNRSRTYVSPQSLLQKKASLVVSRNPWKSCAYASELSITPVCPAPKKFMRVDQVGEISRWPASLRASNYTWNAMKATKRREK